MLDQNLFGATVEASALLAEVSKSTDKKLASKITRILVGACTHLNQINQIEAEATRRFCRFRWLEHYDALVADHERRKVWPKQVCSFVRNLIKIRWRQT